ncbi:CHAD domain-containing protein [Georgenia sp. Z1344]|uniref:CHAD domain-containing protein n=1 Tax=Georgenia sp. Z1344 TaxID=3416706 RepID=UPI003CED679A
MALTIAGRIRRYGVAEDTPLPARPRVPGVDRLRAGPTVLVHEELLDTPDGTLAGEDGVLATHGAALRRTFDGATTLAVEVPHRGGHLVLVDPDQDGEVTDEVTDALQALLRGREVDVVAARAVRRSPVDVLDPGGRVLATFDDDVVGSATQGTTTTSSREWSMTSDDAELLEALDDEIRTAGGRPVRRGAAAGGRTGDLAATLSTALSAQVSILVGWDPLVRCDVPDSVHRMRVAARTLRSIVQVYAPLLEPGAAKEVSAILKGLGRALASARDAEVLRESLDARLADLPGGAEGAVADLVPRKARRRLRRTRAANYDKAHRALLSAMAGPAHWADLERIERFAREVPVRRDASPDDAAQGAVASTLAGLGRAQVDVITDLVEQADAETDDDRRLELLHDVRKEAKRLRYAVVAVQDENGTELDPELSDLVAEAHAVQKRLGTHRDSVMLQEHLLDCARRARKKGEDTFAYGLLLTGEIEHGERALRRARKRLARLTAGSPTV